MNDLEIVNRVLACANKAAGTAFEIQQGEDLPLEVFNLSSLRHFRFMLELERMCGIPFDERWLDPGQLRTIRCTAAVIASQLGAAPVG